MTKQKESILICNNHKEKRSSLIYGSMFGKEPIGYNVVAGNENDDTLITITELEVY